MWTSATTGFSAQSLFPGIAYPSAEGNLAARFPWEALFRGRICNCPLAPKMELELRERRGLHIIGL